MSKVSIFSNAKQTSGKDGELDIILDNIQNGYWQDIILPFRAIADEKKREIFKATSIPAFCTSGTFSERKSSGLKEHSNYIAMDADDCDVAKLKSKLSHDRYVYSVFDSCSGKGLCIIFRINGNKHSESFEGLAEYLFVKYEIVVDRKCKDVSRLRFISFDPYLFINRTADTFNQYPKKETVAVKNEKKKGAVATVSDFENIILKEIEDRQLNLVPTYGAWLNVGFGIANEFGEAGRSYFHRISVFGDYDPKQCDKQFTACLKADQDAGTGKPIATINYFFSLCKQAGISTESELTKIIKQAAYSCKRAASTREAAIKNLHQFENIPPETSTDIINQVFDKNVFVEEVTDISCVKVFSKK